MASKKGTKKAITKAAPRATRRADVFITPDFLLSTTWAERLYHEHAADQPIIDYHCHLPPEQVAADTRFANLAQIWLYGDHYKWRAMRTNGLAERFCTGDASDWEKFQAWAATVPKCLRNPLYHWTHLELKRPFGISDRLLGPDTARSVWEDANALLAKPAFSARGIMRQMKVAVVCTTDDPVDTLEHHAAVAASGFEIQMRPTWRPDRGMAVESPERFNAWVDRLAAVNGADIRDFDSYLAALRKRHDFFHDMGCRLSDHGIETVYADDYTEAGIKAIFAKVRSGRQLDAEEQGRFKSAMLHEGALMDHAKGWVQQFHIGPIRNNSSRMFRTLGADTGFDSIGDASYAKPLARFLDRLDSDDRLAKTILYNINPKENAVLATMVGNFQDGSSPGKIQFGSGWWFLDQKDGMEQQLNALSTLGLLSRFVGMLTDSRSFLSYTRHEYFRRILCNLLGDEMERGLLPRDLKLIGAMVEDICYRNAAGYFDFGLGTRAGRKATAKR
jgi:glucuronate isomerase